MKSLIPKPMSAGEAFMKSIPGSKNAKPMGSIGVPDKWIEKSIKASLPFADKKKK